MSKINYDILGDGLIVNHEEVSTYGAFGKCFKMTTVYCDDMPAEYSPKDLRTVYSLFSMMTSGMTMAQSWH